MSSNLLSNMHIMMIGRANAGKSLLASTATPEYLVLDFDNRWAEIEKVAGQSHRINTMSVVEAAQRAEEMSERLKGKVGTVIVDSGTTLMDYHQGLGRLRADDAKANNQKFNTNDIHRQKADMLRVVRGIINLYDANGIYIFHIDDSTLNGNTRARMTISDTEIARMKKALNCIIEVFRDPKAQKHGVKVIWSRYNCDPATDKSPADGVILWDHVGNWKGFLPKLYDFLKNYQLEMGFNGTEYSIPWLFRYLNSQGKEYKSEEDMVKKLNIETPPLWFDRTAWGEIIGRA